ncbi:MAG TPA: hypothetical protein EYP95_02545 [Nitrospinaceae bacterium]|nr:hypothetical protein [Nitrospinaceae bacterium]
MGKEKHINKIRYIINKLSLDLNLNKAGEVSQRLESLYQFMLSQFIFIDDHRNHHKNTELACRSSGGIVLTPKKHLPKRLAIGPIF